jgi:hypothetical protein
VPRLRRRPTQPAQTLQMAAGQAYRSRACRLGFLAGFAVGSLGVVASLDANANGGASVTADAGAANRRAEPLPSLARTP